MKQTILTIIIAACLLLAIGAASAASVTPEINCSITTGDAASEIAQIDSEGDYTCSDKLEGWDTLDLWEEVSADVYERSLTAGENTITITAYLNTSSGEFDSFDWSSTEELGVVMVKAGSDCYLIYTYDGATGDTGLVAPYDKGVSHTTFGWICGGGNEQEIPEFPTIALPVAAILGLAFFMQRRKE